MALRTRTKELKMSDSIAAPAVDGAPDVTAPSWSEVFPIWYKHLASLAIPLITLIFLWTGPHVWYIAPLFMLPLGILLFIDQQGHVERRQPLKALPAWPFDLLVYTLAGLQFAIVFELARMFSTQEIFSIDMVMVLGVVGGASGFSIITAHELIHRRPRWEQNLGRLLLATVLYEHFYTEHLRGHHRLVGTEEDPATARFGETYSAFWRRTVPAQFRSAWALEARRLGDEEMSLFDPRMLQNNILHGLAVGWGMAFAILYFFGLAAFVAFLLQAFLAVRLLEVVNYFEHWGLQRKSNRVRPQDSWDTHSRFTYYGLTGLSRHADHHAYPARPYQQLRVWDEAPILPTGYVGLVDMVMVNNDQFVERAVKELRRCELGPFSGDATPTELERLERFEEAHALAASDGAQNESGPQWLRNLLRPVPARLRPLLFWSFVVVALTLGAQVEAGTPSAFWGLLTRNAAILAVFTGVVMTQRQIAKRTKREGLAWFAAFAVLVVAGSLTEHLLS
jgi:alkane 1-monooxygenase